VPGERRIGLIAFDVDGVLVPIRSSWEYLHSVFGTYEASRKYLELYERGEISYYDWMFLDTYEWIAKFGGKLHKSVIQGALDSVPVNEGFSAVFSYAKKAGWKTALISAGVHILVERVARHFGADYWFSNILLFDEEGMLIPGGVPLVSASDKGRVLRKLAEELGIEREATVYVGDSRWDESAFRDAGLSVVCCEKADEVRACARAKDPAGVLEAIISYSRGELSCSER